MLSNSKVSKYVSEMLEDENSFCIAAVTCGYSAKVWGPRVVM